MSITVRRRGIPLLDEFRRISRLEQNRWHKASYDEERRLEGIFVGTSVVDEFGRRYGRDPKNIEGWQRFCRDLGFRTVPHTIEECNAVSTRFSNVLECATRYFSSCLDLNFWFGLRFVCTDVGQKKDLRQYRSTNRSTVRLEEGEEGDNI